MQAASRIASLAARSNSANGIDLYAAALSLLCLIHCLAIPLMSSLFPLLGYLTENERVHQGLVLLAAPATLWAVSKSRNNKRFSLAALGGLTLIMLAGFVEALAPLEAWLTVLGALCLASAHLWRWSQSTLPAHANNNQLNLVDASPKASHRSR